MLVRTIATTVLLLFAIGEVSAAPNATDSFYQAIRNNDLAALRDLIKDNGPDLKDARGQTPLMFAAAFGSMGAMKLLVESGANVKAESDPGVTALDWCTGDVSKVRLLLDNGADVNKATRLGRTPLLIAAATYGSLETVKLLLEKGADVNAADTTGFTPLIAAATTDNAEAAKLLIEKGASVNARANDGQIATALMGAAHNANLDLTRVLLGLKADINAVSADRDGNVKNGPVLFGNVTALHVAAANGSTEEVKLLLDSGAPVDPLDVRGMTPLMFAVARDHPHVDTIRLLLARGADPAIQSKIGESTVDWARKFSNPNVLAALKLPAVKIIAAASDRKAPGAAIRTPQEAVERSLPLVQLASSGLFTNGGCIACHAQPVTGMAIEMARARGWHVDDALSKAEATETDRIVRGLAAGATSLMQGREGGGNPDTQLYEGMMMAANGAPADAGTDALVHYLVAKQRAGGNWTGGGTTRAPMQDSDFSRTAMGIRTLTVYAMPARKAEMAERVERAAGWLAKKKPESTEERVMQILGLTWAGASLPLREKRMKELVAQQRSDGGWAQTPWLSGDAYATGQVLYLLHETGAAAKYDAAVRRGVDFLLRTQKDDGSWYVKNRAMKLQPYFESGFPYGNDQWISEIASAWATMALTTAPETTTIALRNR